MKSRQLWLFLCLAVVLLVLAACGGKTEPEEDNDSGEVQEDRWEQEEEIDAEAMRLVRTEGTVGVSDNNGQEVPQAKNMGLYSGYHVATEEVSRAWIELDQVKLAKMDENSEIGIRKEDKHLTIYLGSGGLYFHVEEPLPDDETMEIRCSNIIVGIRGTCGWVQLTGPKQMQVYLLEGEVECQVTGAESTETVTVSAGEMAELEVTEDGKAVAEVLPYAEEYVAPFVMEELEHNKRLTETISEEAGFDVLNPSDPAERLTAEYQEIIASHPILDRGAAEGVTYTSDGITFASEGLSEIYRVDLDGDGKEEVVLITQQASPSFGGDVTKLEVFGETMGHFQKLDEVPITYGGTEYGHANGVSISEKDGQLYLLLDYSEDTPGMFWYLYRLEGNRLVLAEDFSQLSEEEAWNVIETYNWGGGQDYREELPELPDDVRRKNRFLAEISYSQYTGWYFAKLWDVNSDGIEELILIEDFNDSLCYYSWDGSDLQHTELETDIAYAKLIDMNQDGIEELLLIKGAWGSHSANVYFWDDSGIHATELTSRGVIDGLYQEKATGAIYIASQGTGSWSVMDTFSSMAGDVVLDAAFNGYDYRMAQNLEELTPAEQADYDRSLAEFEAGMARFELIEYIDTNSWEWQTALEHTVEEVKQQLMAR